MGGLGIRAVGRRGLRHILASAQAAGFSVLAGGADSPGSTRAGHGGAPRASTASLGAEAPQQAAHGDGVSGLVKLWVDDTGLRAAGPMDRGQGSCATHGDCWLMQVLLPACGLSSGASRAHDVGRPADAYLSLVVLRMELNVP